MKYQCHYREWTVVPVIFVFKNFEFDMDSYFLGFFESKFKRIGYQFVYIESARYRPIHIKLSNLSTYAKFYTHTPFVVISFGYEFNQLVEVLINLKVR